MAVKSYGIALRRLAGRKWDDVAPDLERFLRSLHMSTDFLPTHHGGLDGLGEDDHPQYLKERGSGGSAADLPLHTHASVAEAGTILHADTTGRSSAASHPASAVAVTPVGGLVATDVQAALAELDTEAAGWDDLRFPAQGINPPGAASDATRDTTTGLLLFAGNQDNVIAGAAQMPHRWQPGTLIRPHVHLRFPTSNAGKNTRWKFETDIANVGADFAHASGTYTTLATITVANAANVNRHAVASFGDLVMTGHKESAIILWKLSRLASSDAADDDTNACLLLEFDIHFQVIKAGTPAEYPA